MSEPLNHHTSDAWSDAQKPARRDNRADTYWRVRGPGERSFAASIRRAAKSTGVSTPDTFRRASGLLPDSSRAGHRRRGPKPHEIRVRPVGSRKSCRGGQRREQWCRPKHTSHRSLRFPRNHADLETGQRKFRCGHLCRRRFGSRHDLRQHLPREEPPRESPSQTSFTGPVALGDAMVRAATACCVSGILSSATRDAKTNSGMVLLACCTCVYAQAIGTHVASFIERLNREHTILPGICRAQKFR